MIAYSIWEAAWPSGIGVILTKKVSHLLYVNLG